MEAVFVAGHPRLNAKIEKPPGVTTVVDDRYYYVRIKKRPLEAVEAPMMGVKYPHMPREWGNKNCTPTRKLSLGSLL